jgi:hypothetical protein
MFWARWCAPRRLTLPAVARLAAWAKAKGLLVHIVLVHIVLVHIVLVNTAEGFVSAEAARPEVEHWARVSLPTPSISTGAFIVGSAVACH